METTDVRDRIEKIRAVAGDDEVAHGREKDLWRDVLEAIALGRTGNPAELATAALKTQEIDFMRWYA
jgi:hypothetical protein